MSIWKGGLTPKQNYNKIKSICMSLYKTTIKNDVPEGRQPLRQGPPLVSTRLHICIVCVFLQVNYSWMLQRRGCYHLRHPKLCLQITTWFLTRVSHRICVHSDIHCPFHVFACSSIKFIIIIYLQFATYQFCPFPTIN